MTSNANDYIKPFEEIAEEDESGSAPKKLNPFDFIKSVSETKQHIIKGDPAAVKEYNAYMINRGFGYFPDTVLYANELNMYPGIPKAAQYEYYMASLRKRKRFSKWYKLEKNDDLDLIRKTYSVGAEVAKGYMRILSKENLQTLRELNSTGEVEGKSKKKK
jgi:hypothetical protein